MNAKNFSNPSDRDRGDEASGERQTAHLVETVERVSADFLRRRVIGRALQIAGLRVVPTRVEELTFFVSGPLYEAASGIVDDDYAEALLLELAPILDRAWDQDRKSTIVPPSPRSTYQPTSGVVAKSHDAKSHDADPSEPKKKQSAVQRVIRGDDEEDPIADTVPADDETDERLMEVEERTMRASLTHPPPDSSPGLFADDVTIPGPMSDVPPPLPSSPELAEDTPPTSTGLPAVRVATRDETPPPPRSHRFTVPYLQSVLTPPRRSRRVMIVDGRDEVRRQLATELEGRGYAVVTAHDREVARSLFLRLTPTLVVADVETVAPDFEPLMPAFESLLGELAEQDEARPRILLVSDGANRPLPSAVDAVVDPLDNGLPAPVDDIAVAVATLLPLERGR